MLRLRQRLLEIHYGSFQDDAYLLPWITPAIAGLLLTHGEEMRAAQVVYGVGRPLDCHRNALELATSHPRVLPWFGFSLCRGVWWIHSWVVDGDGVVIDSGPPTDPALYFGIKWGWELYRLIPKRGAAISADNLPAILTRRRYDDEYIRSKCGAYSSVAVTGSGGV